MRLFRKHVEVELTNGLTRVGTVVKVSKRKLTLRVDKRFDMGLDTVTIWRGQIDKIRLLTS